MVLQNYKNLAKAFTDQCVMYYSRKDELWVAHSLHTDQVGTGNSALDAYTHLLSAIRSLITLASQDSTIEVFREAPRKIQERVDNALPLPDELCTYAHKRLRGEWPKEIRLSAESARNRSLAAKITGAALN